ncbi:helix-turn-helix domain-containing protein [Shewanella sp. JBTF-M18]|uniref:Helix-turn-helix domain-containing protein n=1 Tax=Shewanella insulae TaxID=2681496 RepID=A0A6L7I6G2_9GAMM|nr:helix-turn-helix domain-containing protein [Shewanella insulae]
MKNSLSLNQPFNFELKKLVTLTEASQLLKCHRSTVHRRVKAKKLPHPITRKNRTIGWRLEDLKPFIKQQ